MRKRILLLFVMILAVLPSSAVLKEKDLSQTLSILRQELTAYQNDLSKRGENAKHLNEMARAKLFETMQKSNQNSLMLYSQKRAYVFDLAYACHEANEQYFAFKKNMLPFKKISDDLKTEQARYDSLITTLSKMPDMMLSEKAKIDRNVCLTLAVSIKRTLEDREETMSSYVKYYDMTAERLKYLNDYATKSYADIQSNIFVNGSDSYLSILKDLSRHISTSKTTVNEKYRTYKRTKSQWDSRMIIGLFIAIVFYGIISILLNQIVIRLLVKRRMKHVQWFKEKQRYIILASTVITFAIILSVIRMLVGQNFLVMACGLLVEYAWLMGVILLSLLFRLNGKQIKAALRIYAPLLAVGFIVITFRIILIPNDVVNLAFPPVLLACSIWQWIVIGRHNDDIPRSDVFLTYISLVVFVTSVVSSWMGYTLMSVQMLIWWIMQLTCILTITCVRTWVMEYSISRCIKKEGFSCLRGLIAEYERMVVTETNKNKRRALKDIDKRDIPERRKWIKESGIIHHLKDKSIKETWFYALFYEVLIPILCVFSLIISIYWAADVFNLSDTLRTYMSYKFISTETISLSLENILVVISLWFIFNYINDTLTSITRLHFEEKDPTTADSRNVMAKNVLQVVIWGTWLLVSLAICKVSNTWIVVISGGLSTGVGFASKDILENIYYGISLMAGRIRIGDLIECDGTRGKVVSISYTSTLIEAIDGSVIAFQNSQLFTKNYKNLTHNNGDVLNIVEVGVAYGTKVSDVRKVISDALNKLNKSYMRENHGEHCFDPQKGINIILKELGDSSINFKVLTWVPVVSQFKNDGLILETIYNALNEHNIEIPFPQRDIHIIPAE